MQHTGIPVINFLLFISIFSTYPDMRKAWRGSQAFQEKVFRFLWGVAKTI